MKKLSLTEHNLLQQIDDPVLKIKEYKDYLIFSMKKFFINFDMNNKNDMHASIVIGKMSISDAEFNYNKTEAPYGEPYQQFQFIMNTEKILNLEEITETTVLNKSYQSSILSDDDDDDEENKKIVSKNIISNYNNKDEEETNEKFIDINYNLISAENKQIIDISFEKFKFCFPLTSLARLYQFYLYFFGLYLKSMTHTMQYKKKEIIDKERELIKQKILSGEIKFDDDENDNIKVIKEENEDENEINTNENKKPKKKLSYMERLKLAKRKKKKEIEKEKKLQSKIDKYLQIQRKQSEKNLKITKESSKIFVTFKMKEIDMDLPMEPLNKTTKILRFKFNFNSTISMENEFENSSIKDSITNIETITFTKYSKKNMNVTSKIFNIDFCLMDYNEGEAKMDNICNYLINNFRISIFLDSFLLLKDKEENSSNIMNVNIEFEPMMMNLGFVQLKYIMNYTEKLNLLLNEMNTPYDDPLKSYLINDNNVLDENKKPLTFIESQILKSQILTYENIENLKNHMELTQALDSSNSIFNINNDNENNNQINNDDDSIIPSNLDKMNNMMDIELTIDKICIRLLDNTIYNTTPLLKLEYNKISLKYIANSNPNSTENISNVIVESVSKKEIPFNEYKIYGLYQYVYLNFSVEIYFFNDGISDWEPILEKWGGEVKMLQVASFTKLKGEIISDDMCNMNLSLASVKAFNNALKKFLDQKETFFKKKSKDNLGLNESKIALEVINNTGLQIEFWLDADIKFNKIENKNVIKNKIAITEKAYTVNNNKLMHIYNKLDEIGLKLKKDKFSFRIKGYDAISGIDFSGNYFEGYLIKKPKREENENNNSKLISDNNNLISENNNNLINNNIIENDDTEINTNSNNVLIKKLPNKIDINNLSHTQSFIQNKLNLDDSIQIFLKIKQNGLMKSITLESNYCFKNNLNTDIILSFINPEDYKKKFLEEDKNIDHENNNLNRLIIQPGENKPIPLKYIMNHYRVYANLLSHKNNNKKYVFLFKDFTFTQNNLKKYIEYDKSNGDEDYDLENSDSIKVKFNDAPKNENEIDTNENNENFIYAAVDFTIQRSANKSVSEVSYKKNNFMSLYFYLFTFNYYSTIENQLPFDVKIINVNNKENYLIKPLQNFNIPNLNLSENKFKIFLNYFNKDFVSEEIDSNSLKKKPITIKLFHNSNSNNIDENAKDKFINITIKLDSENLNSNTFDPTLIKVIKNFSQRKKIVLFFDYLIINKTNEDLFVGNSNLNDNDFNKFTDRFLVPSKNVSGFSEEKIDKLKFKNNLSSWSKGTNVKTFGMTGVVSLETKNEEKNIVDEISVNITSSNFFTESTVINLEPRFIIVNKLGIDFKVFQYVKEKKQKKKEKDKKNNSEINNNSIFDENNFGEIDDENLDDNEDNNLNNEDDVVKANQQLIYKFRKIDKNFKHIIRIGIANGSKKIGLSSPFKIDDISDYNVQVLIEDEKIVDFINEENERIKNEIEEQKQKNKLNEMFQNNNNNNNINEENEKPEKKKFILNPYIINEVNNKKYLLLKVSVYSFDNGLLYIVLYNPAFNDYSIRNETELPITIWQKDTNSEKITIPPYDKDDDLNKSSSSILNTSSSSLDSTFISKQSSHGNTIKFVFPNLLLDEHKLNIKIKNKVYNCDFISIENNIKNPLKINGKRYYLKLLIENNKTRILVLTNDKQSLKKSSVEFLGYMKNLRKVSQTNFQIKLKGFGLSIIEKKKEILYISTYGFFINFIQFSYPGQDLNEKKTLQTITMSMKNFQIDYCLDKSFENIIVPKFQWIPANDNEIQQQIDNGQEIAPFLQILVQIDNEYNSATKVSNIKYPQFDFTMQEIFINIDQNSLMNLINLFAKFNSQLDFYVIDVHNNVNNINNNNNNEIFPWNYDEYLKPFLDDPEEIITISENSSMIFINYLLLSAIKLKITIRIDITKFDLTILPKPIMKLLAVFGNTLATISDLPLHFNEMIYKDIFTDTNKIVYLIIQHIKGQALRESYKIVGCMDMLGNPIGLVNKVGTGFIEFFNEPRKGFAHGPIGVGEGIVKGVGSLVQNVVGGSFEAIGKITGTFLSATKSLQGEKYNQLQQKEPETLIDGIYSGFKGAIKDFGRGITGIFTNPYKSAKKGGVKGFFKGLGTGIVGLALTPLSMALRLGNNVVVGMKNTIMFNSNLKTRRFRYPRQIDIIALKPYDEDKAMVQAILFYLKVYKNEDIIYFKPFNYFERGFDHSDFKSSLILTNKHVLVVYEAKTLAMEISLNQIKNVEIHKENENVDDSFLIVFIMKKKNRKQFIKTNDFKMCFNFYSLLEKNLVDIDSNDNK